MGVKDCNIANLDTFIRRVGAYRAHQILCFEIPLEEKREFVKLGLPLKFLKSNTIMRLTIQSVIWKILQVYHQYFEPPCEKTNNLHRQKTKTQIRFTVTVKLISVFVFATWIVNFLFFLNPKFRASSSFLCLYRSVCVRPGRKPQCWFSHEAAHLFVRTISPPKLFFQKMLSF